MLTNLKIWKSKLKSNKRTLGVKRRLASIQLQHFVKSKATGKFGNNAMLVFIIMHLFSAPTRSCCEEDKLSAGLNDEYFATNVYLRLTGC